MFTNIIIMLLMLSLTALLGWLTWRAFKAQRKWVKTAGGMGGSLLTLLVGAIAITGGLGLKAFYFPGVLAAPDLTVAGTAEQVARGEYLVNISCIGCHSSVGADGNPTEQHPLTGGWNIAAAEGFGFAGDMVTENLTPGGKLAGYSDGELFRVLRHSVNNRGQRLVFMDFMPYKQLSDDDIEAIIAYLRSLPPNENTVETGDKLAYLGLMMKGAGMLSTETGMASVTAPAEGISAEYGAYVALYGDCRGCHGSTMEGVAESSMGAAVPNPRPLVGTLSEEQFLTMMRTGVRPSGTPFSDDMPWQFASRMSDNDLRALYAYLRAAP